MLKRTKRQLTDFAGAYDFALQKLSYRDRSTKEMELLLKRQGCPPEVASAVIKRLEGYSFLDESGFADKVYAAWLHKKYYGAGHLREELRRRNVRHEEAARILASFTNEQEFERALAAAQNWQRKKAVSGDLSDAATLGKIFRALTARGFAGNLIIKALNRLESDCGK